MTTTTASTSLPTAPPTSRRAPDPLRRILALDAGVCAVGGAALLAAAAPIADRADLAAPTVVQVIGGFLLLLGADLAVMARAPQRWARLGAAATAVGDVAWALASAVVAATAGLPAWATAAVVGQGLVTLAIARAKQVALRSVVR